MPFIRQIHVLLSEVYDYCPSEYFDVACQDNEVIMMESAKYGRMREGRCISRSYQMGCALDVLSFLDNKCSGRQQCNVYVADPFLHNKKPCGMDLASYLEAAYSCVPGWYIATCCDRETGKATTFETG